MLQIGLLMQWAIILCNFCKFSGISVSGWRDLNLNFPTMNHATQVITHKTESISHPYSLNTFQLGLKCSELGQKVKIEATHQKENEIRRGVRKGVINDFQRAKAD